MKRVLITGGSRGLGLALTEALAQSGYRVSTVSRKPSPGLDELAAKFPGQIDPHFADLSQPDQAPGLVERLELRSGLHGFVANAAIGTEGLLTLTSKRRIEECLHVNLLSVILLTREVIKGMLRAGGSLVFISSITAVRGYAGLSVYSATKGALLSFSRSLAREYGPRGIRANCILPGFLETEMTGSLSQEDRLRIQRRTALQRLGEPNDLTGAVRFLLSDEARFVTGSEFIVDGGLTA